MSSKKLVLLALLTALCAVGGFIKIPSPTGTVALDSLPGFLAAALLGGRGGAAVGFLGHLFSAATVGFPLGLPVHLYVGLQMAVYVSIFGYLYGLFCHDAACIDCGFSRKHYSGRSIGTSGCNKKGGKRP